MSKIVGGQLIETMSEAMLRLLKQYETVEIDKTYRTTVLAMAARHELVIDAERKNGVLVVSRFPARGPQ